MKPALSVENGYIILELSPFQCADIAQACDFASEYSFDEKVEMWRTLAALFHACTIAGFAQWHMSGPDLAALLEQLTLLNLRSDDDKSRWNGRHSKSPMK